MSPTDLPRLARPTLWSCSCFAARLLANAAALRHVIFGLRWHKLTKYLRPRTSTKSSMTENVKLNVNNCRNCTIFATPRNSPNTRYVVSCTGLACFKICKLNRIASGNRIVLTMATNYRKTELDFLGKDILATPKVARLPNHISYSSDSRLPAADDDDNYADAVSDRRGKVRKP